MRTCLLILIFTLNAWCDSKAEVELRARLAAVQAQLAAAARDKADLNAALEKLNAAAVARASTATANSRAAAGGRGGAAGAASDASDQADTIARNARDLAQDNADIAKASADLAASKAESDRLRVDAALASAKNADHSILIVQICGLAAILAKFLYDYLMFASAHKWAKDNKDEVLVAVASGQKIVADGLDQANHQTEKTNVLTQQIVDMKGQLLEAVTAVTALPDTTALLANMVKGHAASAEDMGRVLSAVVAGADELARYSHDNVHKLRKLMAVLLAEAELRANAGPAAPIALAGTETPSA